MKAKVYVINENQPGQYYGITVWDGEEWRVNIVREYKTRKGAEKAIIKLGYELTK